MHVILVSVPSYKPYHIPPKCKSFHKTSVQLRFLDLRMCPPYWTKFYVTIGLLRLYKVGQHVFPTIYNQNCSLSTDYDEEGLAVMMMVGRM